MNEEMVRVLQDLMASPPRLAVPHVQSPDNPVEAALAILDAACRFVQYLEPEQRWWKAQEDTRLGALIRAVLSARTVT